jgi:hypothetical protein
MTSLERGDIVLDHGAQAHDFDRVRPQRLLMVIAQGNEEEKSGQERDDNNADGGSREQLEMKMFGAEEPRGASSEKTSTHVRYWVGRVDLRHYNGHKAGSLPQPSAVINQPSAMPTKARLVPHADEK